MSNVLRVTTARNGNLTFSFNQRHDSLLVACTNHGTALAVTDLTAAFNRGKMLDNGAPTNDLATMVVSTVVMCSPFLLAVKVFLKRTALCLFSINVPVNCFVADRQEFCNLPRTPLEFKVLSDLTARRLINLKGITARFKPFLIKQITLSGSFSSLTRVSQNLPNNFRPTSTPYLGNRLDFLPCFHKYVNLITFSLAEMFITYKVTLTCWSRRLKC